jgi:hypothetical protein
LALLNSYNHSEYTRIAILILLIVLGVSVGYPSWRKQQTAHAQRLEQNTLTVTGPISKPSTLRDDKRVTEQYSQSDDMLPTAAIRDASPSIELGNLRSVKGRQIPMYVFGHGEKTVLLIGGVHGDEPAGVNIAYKLISDMKSTPSSHLTQRIVIMPLVNPDGFAAGTRQNAHHIDINRNFPGKSFKKGAKPGKYYGGKIAGSEPETMAIERVVDAYNPYLIISFHAPLSCLNFSGPSQSTAKLLSRLTGLPAKKKIGYPTPGSMGDYYGRDLQRQVITFELPNRSKASRKYESAILEFLGIETPFVIKKKSGIRSSRLFPDAAI